MNYLELIRLYYINPRLYHESINKKTDYYYEIRYWIDRIEGRSAIIDYGIVLSLINGVEFDNKLWFSTEKHIEIFDHLCKKRLGYSSLIESNRDMHNKEIQKLLLIFWKFIASIEKGNITYSETKLSYQEVYEHTKEYYIDKKPIIVNLVNKHIDKAMEYIKYHNDGYKLLHKYIFPMVFQNNVQEYGDYEIKGKECCDYIREELAVNYSSLLGNENMPIHDILNDKNSIKLAPIIYSPTFGLLYIYSNYKNSKLNTDHWEFTDQEINIMKLQLQYFIDKYSLKNVDNKMFVLSISFPLCFNYKIEKLNDIELCSKLKQKLQEITGVISV